METPVDFLKVTELANDLVSKEQVQRSFDRYYWAKGFCEGKAALEVACGTGQGLGYLSKATKRFVAGDYSRDILNIAKKHYGSRINLFQLDGQQLPFSENSMDVIILFEAIYYLPNANLFIKECRRLLKPNGKVLIATANKDLFDFNPSPHTHKYFGILELRDIFDQNEFDTEFFGNTLVRELSSIQRWTRVLKKIAVKLNLMPKTAEGKKWLKKIILGKLVKMPEEIHEGLLPFISPAPLSGQKVNREYKVIFCTATLKR